MRESQIKKIPVTVILGDKEKEDNTVSYRLFGSQETNTLSKEEFIEFINKKITEKN